MISNRRAPAPRLRRPPSPAGHATRGDGSSARARASRARTRRRRRERARDEPRTRRIGFPGAARARGRGEARRARASRASAPRAPGLATTTPPRPRPRPPPRPRPARRSPPRSGWPPRFTPTAETTTPCASWSASSVRSRRTSRHRAPRRRRRRARRRAKPAGRPGADDTPRAPLRGRGGGARPRGVPAGVPATRPGRGFASDRTPGSSPRRRANPARPSAAAAAAARDVLAGAARRPSPRGGPDTSASSSRIDSRRNRPRRRRAAAPGDQGGAGRRVSGEARASAEGTRRGRRRGETRGGEGVGGGGGGEGGGGAPDGDGVCAPRRTSRETEGDERGFARRSRPRATRTPPSRLRSDPPGTRNPPGTTRDSTTGRGRLLSVGRGSRAAGKRYEPRARAPRRSRRGRRAKATRGRGHRRARGSGTRRDDANRPVGGEEVRRNQTHARRRRRFTRTTPPRQTESSPLASALSSPSLLHRLRTLRLRCLRPRSRPPPLRALVVPVRVGTPASSIFSSRTRRYWSTTASWGARRATATRRARERRDGGRRGQRTGRTNRRAGPRCAGGTKGTNARDARLSHTASADSYCAARTKSISSRFMSTTSRAESVATAGAAPGALASPSSRGARVRRHGCEARVDVTTGDRERLRAILHPRVALIAFLRAPRANEPSDSRPERSLVAPNPVWLRKRLCTTGLGAVVNRPRTHLRAARKMATVLGTSSFVGAAPRVGLKVRLASRPRFPARASGARERHTTPRRDNLASSTFPIANARRRERPTSPYGATLTTPPIPPPRPLSPPRRRAPRASRARPSPRARPPPPRPRWRSLSS